MVILSAQPTKIKVQLLILLCASSVIALGVTGIAFYQDHLQEADLNQRVQGLTEYELCQLAYDEFGMKMVEDMGCTVDINSLQAESL